jgi:hypothetical protein
MVILRRRGFLWKAAAALGGAGLAMKLGAMFERRVEGRSKAYRSEGMIYLMLEHPNGNPFFIGSRAVYSAVPITGSMKGFSSYDLLRWRLSTAANDMRHWLRDRAIDAYGLALRVIEEPPKTDCVPGHLKVWRL